MARNRTKKVKIQQRNYSEDDSCYICGTPKMNRRAKPCGPNGELVCGSCRDKNGL